MGQGQSCQEKKKKYFFLSSELSQVLTGHKCEAQVSLQEIPGTFAKGVSDIPKFSWQM